MFRKLIIAAVGALGLAVAGGCEREEGRYPGGTSPSPRDEQRPTTTPPPAPESRPETTPPSTPPETPEDRPQDQPKDQPQNPAPPQETPRG